MKWENPPQIKIYEALGAVADNRVHLSQNSAKVFSSSGNKHYDVTYDPEKKAIMMNDNGSYWRGYLGYPAIAFLMRKDVISYDERVVSLMKGIAWKDINQKFKNDFDKTLEFITVDFSEDELENLRKFVAKVEDEIESLSLSRLGKKVLPPKGY